MDRIIHVALEEICAQGATGITLSLLLSRLSSASIPPCPAVLRALWSGLSAVPGLLFKARPSGPFVPNSDSFDHFRDRLDDVEVFADEQLRRCFVGLYDVKASLITPPQQRVLEKLALARGNGVTQNQLCKELGTPANNFFYVAKRLESWGLVVRQSTIVRTKEASGEKESKNSQPVHTNLIRLRRYALPLGSQQRLEITKDTKNLEESVSSLEECGQSDVLVKDFLPALKAVCDRLEQAEGKVLVVSDIKRELGYRETRGHRAWRNVCNRLKQAGLVEVFEARVDDKVETTTKPKKSNSRGQNKPVSCLRLLKKFSTRLFQHKTLDSEYDNLASEQCGNQIQNTEQLVELPLEQQIFDMIDAEGSKGLLGVEICRRLGISNKMLDKFSSTMVPRFGLHQLSENRNRGSAYRFWAPGKFNPGLPDSSFNRSEYVHNECGSALRPAEEPSYSENSQRTITDLVPSTLQKSTNGEQTVTGNPFQKRKDLSPEDRVSSKLVVWSNDSQDLTHDMGITAPLAANSAESNGNLVEYLPCPVLKPPNLQQGQIYPSLTSTQRELRILERLKTDKIILKPELQRWLESFEKDKQTRMDRKTLTRILKRLTQEGHCKLIDYSIPGVSNCGRPRDMTVIVHPSVEGSASELLDQVHDKVRSFEMQIRSASSPSKKELPVPVLHGVERIQKHSNLTQSAKSEVMRANGFVLAKMVRTKLLHHFLWRYVNTSAKCYEASSLGKHVSSSSPYSSCLLFKLDAAIKAMPLELFLQVVGSALQLKDMIEKCKSGTLLSDLPDEEYKSLMDIRAIGRLSWLIDILHRLKLIRLLADESPKDAAKISHATFVYALELKPYIEEPPSAGAFSPDLRPYFRHDFVLSTSEAVDKYWQTLEYCYATADPKVASHAFPGSVVPEACLFRSWTTVRVMTAQQRDDLLKCIKDQKNEKLTFKDCREIAKDLKLTLEQVLRVYYDNRQQRLDRIQGDLDVPAADSDTINDRRPQSRHKRKIFSEERLAKHVKVNHTAGYCEYGPENVEEPGFSEQHEQRDSLINQCVKPMLKRTRHSRFPWTEAADRHLIIQYARQRAIQGARRGTDWASISDLRAPPKTCKKRIAELNKDIEFRKLLIKLCNLLTQRYAQRLDCERNLMNNSGYSHGPDSHAERWDDFDNSQISVALNEVLMYKQKMKLNAAKRSRSASEVITNHVTNSLCEFEKDGETLQIDSSRRSTLRRLPQKFVKHLNEGFSMTRRVDQSLAVSSAVELFKLVFLTSSKSDDMPRLLAETLRCYSEHDLHSAFDYLRQKKFMVGSDTSEPFVLSQHFLRSLSMSQFPANTGKRAAKFANWICKKDLMEGPVNLPSDLQCGDIFYLFALVSSGELSILPLLPNEGVGEAEDTRGQKRKSDYYEFEDCSISKRLKCLSSQECETRREKGFPGIMVSLKRNTISKPNIDEFLEDEKETPLINEDAHFHSTLSQKASSADFHSTPSQKASSSSSTTNHFKESPDFGSIVPSTVIYGESLWEVMTNYILRHLLQHSEQEYPQISPALIKSIYRNIQKAGDQGLSVSEVAGYMGMQGTELAEQVIDALQLFGVVLKVDGYNSVHVVDGLFRTKYFLTSKAARCQDPERVPSTISTEVDVETNMVEEDENREHVGCMSVDEVHKVTILNLSEDVSQDSNAIQARYTLEGCSQSEKTSNGGKKVNQNSNVLATSYKPILPWINGDGTTNSIVYRGLTRRVLGVVTQNPGTLEDDILCQMEVLNPQSCRRLLELMVLEKHITVRKMTQRVSSGPPSLLGSLKGADYKKPKFICREHYFANPMSTSLL